MNHLKHIQQSNVFQDQFGREKRKLRISVTDRCNFKCVYCMPEHPEWMKKYNLLSFEQLFVFCELMVQHGIEQIRITGGEPLMRKGIVHFIAQLQQLKKFGLKRISMTTNGHYLPQYASQLKHAGLDDLNISLDSLNPAQFQNLTQMSLARVLDGIEAAKQAGFKIKINAVLLKGINDDQIIPIVQWAHAQGFEPRFIEFMPLDGDQNWSVAQVVSEHDILAELLKAFDVKIQQGQGAEPARRYLVNGQSVGIISTVSHSFCGACDRVRLNAQGELFNCLFAQRGLSIKDNINELMSNVNSQNKSDFTEKLSDYIWHKAAGYDALQHELNTATSAPIIQPNAARKISMHSIGG